MNLNEQLTSQAPDGELFSLPGKSEYVSEFERLQEIVDKQRALGREIVVVMGLGFVGAVMAGVVADTIDPATGKPTKFVIGMQRPSTRSYWKIPYINKGIAPVESEDPEVAPLIKRCVVEKKTLIATFTYDVLSLADCVVVDVQCDYNKETFGNVKCGEADITAFEDSLKIIGEKIRPECMVLIETTVPPGTTEYIAYPIVKKAFEKRGMPDREPLLAHSFGAWRAASMKRRGDASSPSSLMLSTWGSTPSRFWTAPSKAKPARSWRTLIGRPCLPTSMNGVFLPNATVSI